MAKNTRNVILKLSFFGLLITLIFSYILYTLIFSEELFSEAKLLTRANLENIGEIVFTTPVSLIIPTIGVSAKVQSVGFIANEFDEVAVPNNFTDVGWYALKTLPGQFESSVIVLYYKGKEVRQAVFFDLNKLVKGDKIIVLDQYDSLLIFNVVAVKVYDFDAPTQDIFLGDISNIKLNLVTYSGDWLVDKNIYNKRTVVFAETI